MPVGFLLDMLVDAVGSILTGGRPRGPRVDGFALAVGVVVGVLTGILLHGRMLGHGTAGLVAWVLLPLAATFLVLTGLGRRDALKGGLVAVAVAVATAVPLAFVDAFSSFGGFGG